MKLTNLRDIDANINDIVSEATVFISACYAEKHATSMSETRIAVWKTKTGSIGNKAPSLQSLPPTSESFLENVKRAHLKVVIWQSASCGKTPDLNPTEFGWKRDDVTRTLHPVTLPSGVVQIPTEFLNFIKCNYSSENPCSSRKCACAESCPALNCVSVLANNALVSGLLQSIQS